MGEEDAIIIDDEDEEEECDMRLMKTKRLPLMMKICENEHSRATRQAYQTHQAELLLQKAKSGCVET